MWAILVFLSGILLGTLVMSILVAGGRSDLEMINLFQSHMLQQNSEVLHDVTLDTQIKPSGEEEYSSRYHTKPHTA